MGLFSDIQDEVRREVRQARMQAEQPEIIESSIAPQQNTQPQEPLSEQARSESVASAPIPVPEPEAPKQAEPAPPAAVPMNDSEAVAASTKRIQTEIERITRRNMKDCVATYLADLCAKDPTFARLVIQPKKSMVNCFRYITRKAEAYAKQEREDTGVTEIGVYGCDVPDDLVYQWAVDYFNDPEADKEPAKKTLTQKPSAATSKTKRTPATPPTPAQPKTQPTPVGAAFEQMSLLG